MWSFHIVRTRTGSILRQVHPVQVPGSWSRRLDYKGTGSHDFNLVSDRDDTGADRNPNHGLWSVIDGYPASRTLVVSWRGRAVYAGLIWEADYQALTQTLTLHHEDLWSVWERRMAAPQYQTWTDDPDEWYEIHFKQIYATFSNVTPASLIGRLCEWGRYGPGSFANDEYKFPLLIPEAESGSARMVQHGYDYMTVAEAISRITDMEDGPSVDWRPEWGSDGRFRWRLVNVDGPSGNLDLHLDAETTPVTGVVFKRSGHDFVTGLHTTGEGSELDIQAARLWDRQMGGDPELVGLEAHERYSEMRDWDHLRSVTIGEYSRRRNWVEQLELTVNLGEVDEMNAISALDLNLGRGVRVRSYDDPVLPSGVRRWTLIGIRPTGTQQMVLELQEEITDMDVEPEPDVDDDYDWEG